MKYRVTAWTEVDIDVIVEADSEEEAIKKTEDSLRPVSYIDSVGIESNDEDVEVDDYDICDDFNIEEVEKESD